MIRFRSALARARTSLALSLGLALTCLALLAAHSGPGLSHMEEMDHAPTEAAVSLCLAVLGPTVLLLGAWQGLLRRIGRRSRTILLALRRDQRPKPWPSPRLSIPRVRAGPPVLQVFLR